MKKILLFPLSVSHVLQSVIGTFLGGILSFMMCVFIIVPVVTTFTTMFYYKFLVSVLGFPVSLGFTVSVFNQLLGVYFATLCFLSILPRFSYKTARG